MTKRRLVNLGEGRIIDMDEEAARKVASTPKPKVDRWTSKGIRHPKKARSKRWKATVRPGTGPKTGMKEKKLLVPGFAEWLTLRQTQVAVFRGKLGFSSTSNAGIPAGMRRARSKVRRKEILKKVEVHMTNLTNAGLLPEDEEIVRKAVSATLEVLEGSTGDMKLRASRQLLEWFKPKPVVKTETKVTAAEDWLAALADQPKAD